MSPCQYNPNPVMKEDKNYPEALSGYGGDILVVGTMKTINFKNKDYDKRQHGGYLGSKSREQSKNE